ncbi:MAG: hypothetical protein K2G36_01420 [Ruminococcus sp.]|nr:hypothetical protein [Ruminococcus sp.]
MKKKFFPVLFATIISGILSANVVTSVYAVESENVTAEQSEIWYTLGELEEENNSDIAILSNYGEFSYNYRDQLTPNNRAVYDALYPIIENPSTDRIDVKLPEPVTVTLSHSPTSDSLSDEERQIFNDAVISNMKNALDTLLMDNPELFWFDEFKLRFSTTQTENYNFFKRNYTVIINGFTFIPVYYDSYQSIDEVLEYKAKLEKAVEEIVENEQADNRYEQLKNIHDYICRFTYYDLNAMFSPSAIGAIVEPGVVCEGYSKAFKLICDALGIPCVTVLGNFDDTDRTAHMWNYVQMEDGLWYAVDVTWDDLNDDENGNILKYEYFLRGSESFNVKHTACGDHNYTNVVYPEISAEDYVFEKPADTTTTTITSTTTTSTTTTTTTAIHENISGDLNHDGKINVADLVYCANAVMGQETEFSCDFNEDGYTDSFDVVLMRKLIIKQ